MAYRVSQIEVPVENPFLHDALERRPLVEFLAGLIGRVGGPFVIALDSPWGSGKTTLVHMLESELKRQDYQCVYFNAWQVDYVTDPLVALVSSIDRVELSGAAAAATFKDHLKTIRRVTNLVAKRGAVAAAKALTVGALDIDEEIKKAASELAGGVVSDIVEAFHKEKALLGKFRTEMEAAVALLPSGGKKQTLVFFIDELDRCRPTFAIELLERIKHLFDVANIVFVLSIDKQQLEASTAAVYGQGIDAREYLRRFIDLEYGIPSAKTKRFTESLFKRFGLDEIFARRSHPELRSDRSNFINFFTSLADAVPLSLRARERCITRLCVVMDQTPDDHYLEPILVALLIVLRSNHPDLFRGLCVGHAGAKEVMAYLGALPGGKKIVTDRAGLLIEAYLIATDEDDVRKAATATELKALANDEKAPDQSRNHPSELLEMLQHISRPLRDVPRLGFVARKVDLSAGLKD